MATRSMSKRDRTEVLEVERVRLRERIAGLQEELARVIADAESRSAPDTDASDAGSGDVERDRVTALLAAAHDSLAQLDAAARRAEAGTWGVCATCGKKISAERLAALPAATTCVDCAKPGLRSRLHKR